MKNALLQMHVAVLLWGFTGVLGKVISVDAPVLVWYRTLLTAMIMAVLLVYRRQWVAIAPSDRNTLLAAGALIGIHWVAFYGSIQYSNASIALVCLSTAPVFTSLLDPLVSKGKYNVMELLLGLLALGGVYLISLAQDGSLKGILFGVVAAILSSVFTVMNKQVASKYPSRTIVFYEMSAGWGIVTIVLAILMLTGHQDLLLSPKNTTGSLLLIPQGRDWIYLPILALCCTVWAQSLALNALKKLSAFTVTLSVNLEPVYGVILAIVLLKENTELTTGFYVGVGLILLSVALQVLTLLRPKLSPGFIKEKAGLD